MGKSTILATISDKVGNNVRDVTIEDYQELLADKNQKEIAVMIYHRFYGRYIKPFMFDDERYRKFYKHGFVMMASSCLLIETLQSFENGWEETPKGDEGGGRVFESFFKSKIGVAFKELANKGFYKRVRCGLLHQGETTGGFTIGREPTAPLFSKKRINAHKFLTALERSLTAYTERLSKDEWDSKIWDNFRRKMRFIISHCGASR